MVTSSQRPNLRPTSRSVPTTVEPAAPVQRDRRLVAADDAGDHGVEAVGSASATQLGEQRPGPRPCPGGRGARRPSPRPWSVRRPVPVGRQRPEADDLAARRRRPPRRGRRSGRSSQRRCSSSVRGTRSKVTVDSEHLAVVDRPDRLGVVDRRQAHARIRGTYCRPARRLGYADAVRTRDGRRRAGSALCRASARGSTELAGEGLEAGPGGDVLVLGEEDDLRAAGRAAPAARAARA